MNELSKNYETIDDAVAVGSAKIAHGAYCTLIEHNDENGKKAHKMFTILGLEIKKAVGFGSELPFELWFRLENGFLVSADTLFGFTSFKRYI